MNWEQLFDPQTPMGLALPILIGIVIIVVLYFLRRLLYSYIRKLTAKTATCFDDIFIRETRLATWLWCLCLGIWAGYQIARTPTDWKVIEDIVVPVLFVALGIYTAIMIVVAFFKWYKEEICPRTHSSIDEIIMSVLIIFIPVVGSGLGLILILKMLGIESVALNGWLSEHLPKLGFLTVLAIVLLLITTLVVPRAVTAAVRSSKAGQTEAELKKRSDTLVSVIGTTIQIIILFIFLLMVLSELTINIAAFLTGAGVLGLAVGFGAQSLVKDVLAGTFIIMENQYRKGDVVAVAGISGLVEEINLRRTILRDLDGTTHIVPNGEIKVASNFTKQWSRANFNITVAYDTDLDKAMAVINRVGKELAEDPEWAPLIISPPKALRVDNLGASGIEIKVLGETKPISQWDVMGELRLRLKKEFDKEGIEIPWPHMKVYFGNTPPQVTPQQGESPTGKKAGKA